MKNTLILLLFVSSLKSFSFKKDSILPLFEDLKNRTLLVCLETEDKNYIDKLIKRDKQAELKSYQKALQLTNENYILSVKKFWTLNSRVKFIQVDSLYFYSNGNQKEFAYLTFQNSTVNFSGAPGVENSNSESRSYDGLKLFLCGRSLPIATCVFPIDEIGKRISKDERKDNILLSYNYVPASKFIFIIHRFHWLYLDALKSPKISEENSLLTGYNNFERAGELKGKTIYLKNNDCESDFDIENVKDYYPYSIKIVPNDVFENAILNKESGIICVFVLVVGGSSLGNETATVTTTFYMHSAVNAEDGSISICSYGKSGFCKKSAKDYVKYVKKYGNK